MRKPMDSKKAFYLDVYDGRSKGEWESVDHKSMAHELTWR